MWAQQDLVGRVVALLQAAPAVAQHVTRRVARPVDVDITSVVRVGLGPSRGEQLPLSGPAPVEWSGAFVAECAARCGSNQAPDEAVGPIVAAVYSRLMADTTLAAAGFYLWPEFEIVPDQEEADERIGSAAITFNVRWRSPYASVET